MAYAAQHLALVKKLGDHPHEQTALTNLGNIYARSHQPTAAVRCYQSALTLAQTLKHQAAQADLHDKLGYLHLKQHDWETSEYHYQTALELARQQHDLSLQAKAWNNLGAIHLFQDQFSDATDCVNQLSRQRHP
ncbi:MAG: tetratricopeptide repeat protein [Cyanobacteria bacterium J06634_6]